MSKSVYLLIFTLILLYSQKVNAQNISNEGTEFWAVFPTHRPTGANTLANITIYVTSKENSEVTVSCGTYTSGPKAIPANTSVPFEVPRNQAYIDETESYPTRAIAASVLPKGIHVKVTDNQPKVAAYAHIYAGRRSAASLLLPVEAAGQKYYSMNFTQSPNEGNNFIVIVATEDDTDVRIHNGNTIIPIHLNLKGDVFEYRSIDATDLTGTFIDVDPMSSGCKKFVAFSGSSADNIGDCVLAPNTAVSRDPLFQQLYPVNSWGKNYGIVPFIDRRHIIRVLAQEDNTTVKTDGILVATLNAGMYYTSPISSAASLVTADKNISVTQYSLSQACSGVNGGARTGDPEMILLNPVEFNIKKITLFSSKDEAISEKYINIYMKTSGTSTFKIDGAAPNKPWLPVPSNPEYSYIQIGLDIELTSVTLMADVGFNAVAYGFGNVESYGYSAGTNLASNNYLLVTNESKTLESPDACVDEPASFKVVLPYQVSKIIWTLNEGVPFVDAAPVATPIIMNGEVYYAYFYLANKEFELADLGENEMKVDINLAATMAGCPGAPLALIFKFNVDALPVPDFDFTPGTNICPDVPVQFFDRSNSNTVGKNIARWTWTFDDGKIETTQNPFHTFTSGGEHSVKLSVATETGCMSDVKDIPVNVRPRMTAKFSAPSVVCPSIEFSITDQSSIETNGKIAKWFWNFGDGKPTITKFDALPFTYSYSEAGSYTITLVTESENDGCQSLPSAPKVVTVASLPNVNFEIPTVCQAEVAVFKNTSTNELGTETGLQYFWDFGDTSNPAMNTSQLKVGAHLYLGATDYNVTLTVINASGCKNVKTQKISVNGATPVPIFSVANMDKLCSNREVVVTSTSYVLQGGNLTKLEWQPDFVNRPEWIVTDDSPTSGESYSFDYKAFNTPETKIIKYA